eukprot:TRINITY_DN26117_c0_g1_i1.p1 TRINITY_DN26117_c0_g1~~TRINITY_DN26117_c0_g1_i1.p1  ORF type:complete len:378 (+),score=68.98 TRINITY_DN26117_c0_g1_i1:93-1226(+)
MAVVADVQLPLAPPAPLSVAAAAVGAASGSSVGGDLSNARSTQELPQAVDLRGQLWDVLHHGDGNDGPFLKRCACVPVEGKGLGVVAAELIERGDCLLAEHPLIDLPDWDDEWEELLISHEHLDGRSSLDFIINHQLSKLSRRDVATFWGLHDCFADDAGSMDNSIVAQKNAQKKTAVGIWQTNGIKLTETQYGLFVLGSCFNHSCRPNVSRCWVASAKKEVFRAIRDIAPGEELFIWYCDPWGTRTDRQEELFSKFNFKCSCPVCSLDGAELALSDLVRTEYRTLHEAVRVVAEGQPRGSVEAVMPMVALAAGDLELAASMMRLACDAKRLAEGEHEGTREWQTYANDPALHPCPCGSQRPYRACCRKTSVSIGRR